MSGIATIITDGLIKYIIDTYPHINSFKDEEKLNHLPIYTDE